VWYSCISLSEAIEYTSPSVAIISSSLTSMGHRNTNNKRDPKIPQPVSTEYIKVRCLTVISFIYDDFLWGITWSSFFCYMSDNTCTVYINRRFVSKCPSKHSIIEQIFTVTIESFNEQVHITAAHRTVNLADKVTNMPICCKAIDDLIAAEWLSVCVCK